MYPQPTTGAPPYTSQPPPAQQYGLPTGYPQAQGQHPQPHPGQQQAYGAPPQPFAPSQPYPQAPPQFQSPQQFAPQIAGLGPPVGDYQGVHYEIMYRDCNTMVKFVLQPNVTINAVSGSMVAHSANVKLEGKIKLKKMFTAGSVNSQTFTAQGSPGEVYLSPDMYADVICLQLDGQNDWTIGGGFLASTSNVKKTTNMQGLGKAMFSGEGLFVTRLSGQGIAFVSSLGAIHPIDLAPGQEYVIDNGHLVAWHSSMSYTTESAGSGFLTGMTSGEGRVCRFRGPGRVYLQTRNPDALGSWIASHVRTSSG
ncbi:hypothetical protein HK104_002822 [Borealophlyctis nickersoniae]|nr:hypothetical protein HK104_002822 [Borealophlyctis nickersoniae]